MECSRNDTDRGKRNYSEKNTSLYSTVYHKSHKHQLQCQAKIVLTLGLRSQKPAANYSILHN